MSPKALTMEASSLSGGGLAGWDGAGGRGPEKSHLDPAGETVEV